jgi:hypothetical protein
MGRQNKHHMGVQHNNARAEKKRRNASLAVATTDLLLILALDFIWLPP